MEFVNNEPEQIEIRRSRNTLIVVGTGTVIFGVWTMVKMLGSLFILREETVAAFKEQFKDLADIPDGIIFWILAAATFIVLAVALAIRAYVGLSAIAEGRGKRRKSVYIVLAIFMILAGIASFIAGFFSTSSPEQYGALSRNQSFSALIIEATSMIMMIQMIVSAIKVRTLTRKGRNAKD